MSETSAFPEVYELYEKRVNTPTPPKKKSEQIDAEEANNLRYYPIFILHVTLAISDNLLICF